MGRCFPGGFNRYFIDAAMNGHFDIISSFYDRVMGGPDRESLQALLRLPSDGWLLDAGGGTGRVSACLRPYVGGLVVSDLSDGMLKKVHKKGDLLPLRAMSESLPFSDGLFSRILVVDALHHFKNQQQAIGELLRVLAPGGRLVIEEPDISRRSVKFIALIEKVFLMGSRFLGSDEIISVINGYGLSASVADSDHHRMWLVADK